MVTGLLSDRAALWALRAGATSTSTTIAAMWISSRAASWPWVRRKFDWVVWCSSRRATTTGRVCPEAATGNAGTATTDLQFEGREGCSTRGKAFVPGFGSGVRTTCCSASKRGSTCRSTWRCRSSTRARCPSTPWQSFHSTCASGSSPRQHVLEPDWGRTSTCKFVKFGKGSLSQPQYQCLRILTKGVFVLQLYQYHRESI